MNPKEITPAELLAHPLIHQVTRDIQETRIRNEQQRQVDQGEQQRLRAEAGRIAHDSVQDEVRKYEELRLTLDAQLRRIWMAEQDFQRIVKHPSGVFAEQTFMNISIPSLVGSQWDTGYPTTKVAVMAYMQTAGKSWN